jgi:hypothetical protein
VKRTFPLPWKQVNRLMSFYVSVRFDGDVKGAVPTAFGPGYLSGTAVILGAGASSKTWHHFTAWGEAGEAFKYLNSEHDAAVPDYRGGLNFAKGFGSLLGSRTSGMFYETTGDAVYVSRFDKDWLFYSQHRAGRTFQPWGHTSLQLLLNANYVRDVKNEYWANSIEIGPGLKLHPGWMPPNVYFSVDLLRGVYLEQPYVDSTFHRHYNYNDVRVGFWYARTR